MTTGTILGEELRQGRQADKRDAARYRALASVDLLAWLPIPEDKKRKTTLAEFADALISAQTTQPKTTQ